MATQRRRLGEHRVWVDRLQSWYINGSGRDWPRPLLATGSRGKTFECCYAHRLDQWRRTGGSN